MKEDQVFSKHAENKTSEVLSEYQAPVIEFAGNLTKIARMTS